MRVETEQQKLVSYIEQYWYEYNAVPSVDQMIINTGLSDTMVTGLLADERFNEALNNRGLEVIPVSKLLSSEQLMVANSIMDFADDRPVKSKLNQLGVSTRAYSSWLKQAKFKQYLKMRAEQLFGDAMPEAHLSLVNSVRRGDLSALKLYYEMTGVWSSKTVEETNIEFLMMKLIEIIQKHVQDPVTLNAIAEDIGGLMPRSPVGALSGNDSGRNNYEESYTKAGTFEAGGFG